MRSDKKRNKTYQTPERKFFNGAEGNGNRVQDISRPEKKIWEVLQDI
jgi:hypothetical protein